MTNPNLNKKLNFILAAIFFSAFIYNSNAFSANKLGESFSSATFPPTGWSSVHISGLSGAGTWVRSVSGFKSSPACAQSDGTLLGDNWLITKQFTPAASDSVVFYVSSNYAVSALGRLEVKVSTTGNAVGNFLDFVIPVNINLSLLTPNVYFRKAVSLSNYGGTPIYIAFRHIEVAALFGAVRLDNIAIGGHDVNLTALVEGHVDYRRDRDTVVVNILAVNSPHNIIESKKVYLDTLGKKTINFTLPEEGIPYYIGVRHHNSITTWSRSGGEIFTGTINYDFTTGLNKAYANNMKIVNGKAAFFTGDTNQDGVVDITDLAAIENDAFNYVMGPYVATDLNWEEFVDITDLALCDNNAYIIAMEEIP
ncbi:MAG: choice-of-anchor J domain-containing protein [Bacteroidota bacterium]|nr:choice-of-anchor J domain-containing protein [Bacteroidota bacterium]